MEENSALDYKEYFKNKRITKQGFGVLGRGLGVAKFLIESGADIVITDVKEESNFTEQIEELNNYIRDNNFTNKVEYYFGGHRESDFINCDFVIQASGVPKDNIYLQVAKDNNIPVYQESSLFLKIINEWNSKLEDKDKIITIGITGTRGKTTTTMLLYKILTDHYKSQNIHLGGNIRDISTISILKSIKPADIILMEMDSWILQGLKSIEYSPNIAVWTTFMEDHLNYYKGDMREYFYDKANIFLYQKERDILLTTTNIYSCFIKYLDIVDMNSVNNRINIKYINTEDIIKNTINLKTNLIGEHNKLNINFALEVAKYLRISEESYLKSIEDFVPVDGRLQIIKEVNNIKYYNDSTSTTPDATMAALNAMSGPTILICGGRDKDISLENLIEYLNENYNNKKINKIIFLKNDTTTGTDKLLSLIAEKKIDKNIEYELADTLQKAIQISKDIAKEGYNILFSPGFASFIMFKNEYDRSDQFIKLVNELQP